ncbi:MarR family winged helix-turn-helix transcriptional regulator [Amycolatopsis sp. Poz14]|uniref:MarR family winged helix-turn-helix transcriptional regulator n=1 Tax=Amycolatopsis sp. Poz14 TaxID=1447705 RepID=UPI001EE989CA|nr:MarR family transcriptional regulator [Amycolatopsis sp. Poz14]MCG3754021.1 MarR family transcriptional regulator [Amycolatopsis sp. Poz14]
MDAVDGFSAQWAEQRPGIDTEPLEAWGRLKRTAGLFDKVLSQGLEECDLNMGEFEVLAALVRQGVPFEVRPTELTRALIITPGAVTARLSALERRGLIARRSDPDDKRVALVSLTARGLHVFEPAFDRIVSLCGEILDGMDPADRTQLHASLRGLLGSVEGKLSPSTMK